MPSAPEPTLVTPWPAPCVSPTPAKRPGHCPHCCGIKLARKGTRTKKLEVVQLWQCLSCSRDHAAAPAELRNKTYPLRFDLEGVSLYNLGYSLTQAAAKLKSRHGSRVPPSTTCGMDRRASGARDLCQTSGRGEAAHTAAPNHSHREALPPASTSMPITGQPPCLREAKSTCASPLASHRSSRGCRRLVA